MYREMPYIGLRQSLLCTQDWHFIAKDDDRFAQENWDDSAWDLITLPHTNREVPHQDFQPSVYQFVSWYRKRLHLPEQWLGKRINLLFDGAMSVASVYVNGRLAAVHKGGYTPFSVDLTHLLHTDGREQVIAVQLDSTRRMDIPPEGGVVDYLLFGGIYRRVFVECVDDLHIEDLFIHTVSIEEGAALLETQVTVANQGESTADITVVIDLESPSGESFIAEVSAKVATGATETRTIRFSVRKAKLWHPDHPFLYTAKATLFDAKRGAIDDVRLRVGIRTIEFAPEHVWVSGQAVKLRGLNRHQMFPYIGNAAPPRLQRKDAEVLKRELGLNFVRTSHYPQDPAFLDACDELGLLVLTELPGWQHIGNEQWQSLACDHLQELILRDRNRACVFLWGVRINESPDHHEFYTATNALAHSLDPTRMTCGVRNRQGGEVLEDVYAFNDFSMRAQPTVRVPQLITEFVGHMFPTKITDPESRIVAHALAFARIVDDVYGRSDIVGCAGWCAFDYNTHPEFGSGSQVCYHGVMNMFRQPKWAGAFYQSQRPLQEGCTLTIATHLTHGSPEQAVLLGELGSDFVYDRDWSNARMPLYVFSNCDEVELIVHGFSLGRRGPERSEFAHLPHPPFRFSVHPYQIVGEVKALGYHEGKLISESIVRTPGGLARLELTVDDEVIQADGSDMTRVVIRGTDELGTLCPYATRVVCFAVDGPGVLVGENPIALEGGLVAIYIRSTKQAGEIRVRATAQNVAGAEVTLQSCLVNALLHI